jgi:hypothetical protein
MQSELSQAIKQLVQERGIPEDLVMKTIENFLKEQTAGIGREMISSIRDRLRRLK